MIDFVLRPAAGLLLCALAGAILVYLPAAIRRVRELLDAINARREAADSAQVAECPQPGDTDSADGVSDGDEPDENLVADDVERAHRAVPPRKRERESA